MKFLVLEQCLKLNNLKLLLKNNITDFTDKLNQIILLMKNLKDKIIQQIFTIPSKKEILTLKMISISTIKNLKKGQLILWPFKIPFLKTIYLFLKKIKLIRSNHKLFLIHLFIIWTEGLQYRISQEKILDFYISFW